MFVIVSGLPGSGKSTVASGLADDLGFPLFDKDDYLEALFVDTAAGNPQQRALLSRRADAILEETARRSAGGVLSSWWRHPKSNADSGTPVSWLTSLPGQLVEVHCVCPPAVAATRFLTRTRHPGHCDERHSEATLLSTFVEQATLGPLGVGSLVEVDSELVVDRAALAVKVRALVGRFA
jgi:glucokinase